MVMLQTWDSKFDDSIFELFVASNKTVNCPPFTAKNLKNDQDIP